MQGQGMMGNQNMGFMQQNNMQRPPNNQYPNQNQNYNNYGRNQYQATTDDGAAIDDRPDLVRTLMFHRGLGEKATSMPSMAFRSIDLTDQLEMRRPMLVAEFDGPAAQLRLSGHGSAPKMAQTTVVRVILALKSAEAPAAKP